MLKIRSDLFQGHWEAQFLPVKLQSEKFSLSTGNPFRAVAPLRLVSTSVPAA